MKSIKYETIKRNAVAEFVGRAGGTHRQVIGNRDSTAFLALVAAAMNAPAPLDPDTVLQEWISKGVELINRWDIRKVAKLVELFPSCVPKYLHDQPICCDMADDADATWYVHFGA